MNDRAQDAAKAALLEVCTNNLGAAAQFLLAGPEWLSLVEAPEVEALHSSFKQPQESADSLFLPDLDD